MNRIAMRLLVTAAVAVICVVDAASAAAGTLHEVRTLTAPVPVKYAAFGGDLSFADGAVLVGAEGGVGDLGGIGGSPAVPYPGHAYWIDTATGATLREFGSPDPNVRDGFGRVVDIAGSNAFVSYSPLLFRRNVVQVDLNTGSVVRNFPSPGQQSQFGFAIDAAGSTFAATDPVRDRSYLFDIDGGALRHVLPVGGRSIATNHALVALGMPGFQQVEGVNVYDAQTGEQKYSISSPYPNIDFGYSLAISGNLLVVGAPATLTLPHAGVAFLYELDSGTLLQELHGLSTVDGSQFGVSVATDGRIAVVGAPGHASNRGAAYVFDVVTGAQMFELRPTDPAPNDRFGNAIDVLGGTVAVGAYLKDGAFENTGAVYLFQVPEPSTLLLMLVGGCTIGRRIALHRRARPRLRR